jgi:hypothetical protein
MAPASTPCRAPITKLAQDPSCWEHENVSRGRRETRGLRVSGKRARCVGLRAGFVRAWCRAGGRTPLAPSEKPVWNTACGCSTAGRLAHSGAPRSRRRSPTCKAIAWRVFAAMASPSQCLCPFFAPTRHLSSASAARRGTTPSVGPAGGWTGKGSGPAPKRSPIQCQSPVRLTPAARPIPRTALRSRHSCARSVRCSSALRRSSRHATHWRPPPLPCCCWLPLCR